MVVIFILISIHTPEMESKSNPKIFHKQARASPSPAGDGTAHTPARPRPRCASELQKYTHHSKKNNFFLELCKYYILIP